MRRFTSLLLALLLVSGLVLALPLSAFGAAFSVNTPAAQISNGITATLSYTGSLSGPGTVFEEGETVTVTVVPSGTAQATGVMVYRVFSDSVPISTPFGDLSGYSYVNAGVAAIPGWLTFSFTMPAHAVSDIWFIWGFTETPAVTEPTITATPQVLPHTGGASFIYADQIRYFLGMPYEEVVIAYDGATEVWRSTFIATGPMSGVNAVVLPPNTSTTTDKVYTLKFYSSYDPGIDATTTVTVLRAPSYPILQHFTDFTGKGTSSALIDQTYGGAFVNLWHQGSIVDPSNYTVSTDATTLAMTITLSEAYLKTFANGSYTFVAEFADGETGPISLLVKVGVPPTGDATAVVGFVSVMALLAGAGVLASAKKRFRR